MSWSFAQLPVWNIQRYKCSHYIKIALIKGCRCANASLYIIQNLHLGRSVLENCNNLSGHWMKSKIFLSFFEKVFLTSGFIMGLCQLWLALMLAAAPCTFVRPWLISDHIRVQRVTRCRSGPCELLHCLRGTCFGSGAEGRKPNWSHFRESRLISFFETWQSFICKHLCCWNTSFWFFSFSIWNDSTYSFAHSQHEVICMAALPLVP